MNLKKVFIPFLIFLFGFSIRYYFIYFKFNETVFGKYPLFAERLLDKKTIDERILDVSPFYLYFIKFLREKVGYNWKLIRLIQSMFGSLNCVLIYLIAKKLFNSKIAIISGLTGALYKTFIVFDDTIEPETLLIFFNLLFTIFIIKALEEKSSSKCYLYNLISGLFLGLSCITKPNSLILYSLLVIYFSVQFLKNLLSNSSCNETNKYRTLFNFISLSIGIFSMILPVTYRNIIHTGDYVLITSDAGKVFYHGNAPEADGINPFNPPGEEKMKINQPDKEHVSFRLIAMQETGLNLTPSQCSKFWFIKTLKLIANNPKKWIKLVIRKILFFFNVYEHFIIPTSRDDYSKLVNYPLATLKLIFPFSLLGLILGLKKLNKLFVLYFIFVTYFFTSIIFFVTSRYRIPVTPALIIFFSYALFKIYIDIKKKEYKGLIYKILLVFIFFLFTNTPVKLIIKI